MVSPERAQDEEYPEGRGARRGTPEHDQADRGHVQGVPGMGTARHFNPALGQLAQQLQPRS